MSRLLTAKLGLLLVAGAFVSASRPAAAADAKASRADRLKSITAGYERKFAEFARALQGAKNEQERREADKRKPSDAEFGKQVLALVKESPADGVSYNALLWIIENIDSDDSAPQRDEAIDLFEKHHLKSPRLKSALSILAECECEKADGLLEKLGKQGATPAIRGLALFHLAVARYERFDGKDEKTLAGIEDLLARVQKDYGDIQPDDEDQPLSRLAEGTLFEIRFLRPGKVVPDLAGTDVVGKTLKLSSFRGKVVLLVFWGTWCGPCLAKVPFERKLMEKFSGRPFTVVGVNCGDSKNKAASVMKEQKMNWPSFFDGEDGPIVSKWNVSSFPTVYLIDAEGIIRVKDPPDDDELEKAIGEAIKEADGK